MTTRSAARSQSPTKAPFHIADYLRIIYRRRWTAALAVLVVFVYGAFGTLRKTPIYTTATTVLLELDNTRSNSLQAVLEEGRQYKEDDAFETQLRVLQSRQLAWLVVQKLGLDQKLATQKTAPVPQSQTEPGLFQSSKAWVLGVVGAPKKIDPPPADETTQQAGLTSAFLGGLSVTPIRNTYLVELRYHSADPEFAARAVNELAA